MVAGGGSLADPPGRAGLAWLTAQALALGTTTRSAREVREHLEALGARLDVTTDWDATFVRLSVLARHTPAALEVLGDVLQRPAFRSDDVARARDGLAARSSQARVHPADLADAAWGLHLLGPLAAGWPPTGTDRTLAASTREDVVSFHAQRYRADAVTVAVTGWFKAEDMVAVLERALGTMRAGSVGTPKVTPQPWPRRARVLLLDVPDAAQAGLVVGQWGVERDHPLATPGAVLTQVLVGGETSRLATALASKGIPAEVRGTLHAGRTGGTWRATLTCPPQAVPDALAVLLAEVERVQRVPPSRREVDEATALLSGRARLAAGTPEASLRALLDGGEPAAGARAPTVKEVARAAQALLEPGVMRVAVVGPASVLETPLQRWGAVETRPAHAWWVEPPAEGPAGGTR
jgi:zinc protease